MKKVFVISVLVCLIFVGVQLLRASGTGYSVSTPDIIVVSYCGKAEIAELTKKDGSILGSVMVSNNEDSLTLQVFAENDVELITDLKIYVGSFEAFPFNKPANPKIGHFPYKESFADGVESYAITIPLDELQEHIIISVKAEFADLIHKGGDGHHSTTWCTGREFNGHGNWAMFFDYDLQVCEEESDRD